MLLRNGAEIPGRSKFPELTCFGSDRLKKPSPLEKRIKRNITARSHTFFAVTSPGLKKACHDELIGLGLDPKKIAMVEGGVVFGGAVHDCYAANLKLRTASRILMRIGEFKASNFRDLNRHIAKFPWELYLTDIPEVTVSARHSRLYHSDAIRERLEGWIHKSLNENAHIEEGRPDSPPQRLFVRVLDDRFTISQDASGDLLHIRGLNKSAIAAPLRETLASGLLTLAGYDPKKPLVDPMCGSGTFSLEAAMMAQNIPAGWFREFAFMGWPCFRFGRWKHARREAEQGFTKIGSPMIFSSDVDKDACAALEKQVATAGLSGAVAVTERDFFDFSAGSLSISPNSPDTGLVMINPPYGIRLGSQKEAEATFGRISSHLKRAYRGWDFGIISPGPSFTEKLGLKFRSHPFSHGGLKLSLLTGKVDK